jgi:hypothetical protein
MPPGSDPASLGGSSGWVGAGLLGLVLAWLLLRHLPDKDRQLSDWMVRRDAMVTEMVAHHDQVSTDQRKDFRESLGSIIAQHDREFSTLVSTFSNDLRAIGHRLESAPWNGIDRRRPAREPTPRKNSVS